MHVDWNQAIDMQESVVGWLKKQLLQRENKRRSRAERGRPWKTHPAHTNTLTETLQLLPERVRDSKWLPGASATCVDTLFCFCLTWFHLFYWLALNLFPSFTFSVSRPPSFSPPHAHEHMHTPNKSGARRCEGCVSNVSQVQIKCSCYDKRCIAFPHSNTLLTFSFIPIVWKIRHWTADLNIWHVCCLCHMRQRLQRFPDKVKLGVKSVWTEIIYFVRSVWVKLESWQN